MNTIEAMSRTLAAGGCTAVALVRSAFERARADDGMFTLRDEAAALAFAAEADCLRAAGDARPLLGVPVTIKDNFDLAGYPTTAGSNLLAFAEPAAADAVAVARLRAAGMVVLGRTGMTEFAFSGLGLNPHHGTPINPAFPGELRIPGGSSSGAAVSVARGLVPAALGTDTGGSIRIPAAFCGLVGFKPTADAISRAGVLPLSTSLDSIGVIATSVLDCRTMFDAIRDTRASDWRQPAEPLRLGMVTNFVRDDEDQDVAEAFADALGRLVGGGVRVSTVHLSALDRMSAIAPRASFSAVEAALWHRDHLAAGRGSVYDPRVLSRILPGAGVDAAEIAAMAERRAHFAEAFRAAAAPFDALVWPTVPMVAPLFAELDDDGQNHAVNQRVLRNPSIVNLADGCAISLPCHRAGAAPVGLTLAAPGGDDDALLAAASIVEPLLSFH